jgi:hypothetical protein
LQTDTEETPCFNHTLLYTTKRLPNGSRS